MTKHIAWTITLLNRAKKGRPKAADKREKDYCLFC